MPKAEVRSTTWRRVGPEMQEAEGHRVHAQKDWIADAWRFVAVRKGDGVHECEVLGTYDTAKEAREVCEADVYEFHWEQRDVSRGKYSLSKRR